MSGSVKSSRRTRVNLVADFETTTDPLDCRVWSWAFVSIDEPDYDAVQWGTALDGFLNACMARNANIYFHNLKFDGTFIMDWLLKHGYTYSTSKYKLAAGEFKAMISDMGKFYSITVEWKNGKTTEFRDSAKKLPMTLKRVAESFDLPQSKGEIDYDAPRPIGYELTPEEIDYIKRDVVIIAQALKLEFEAGMTKLTVASDSMAEYKRLYGDKLFKRTFPTLPTEIDKEIRYALRGGFTYADERFRGKVQGSGLVLDVNSLYPYIMYESFLPYGEPKYFGGRFAPSDLHPLGIFSITFTARIKPNHIPCIQIKGQAFFVNTEYLKVVETPTTLWVTSVDWELWNEHYDIEVLSYNGGWAFRAAHGFFDEYIDKWMKVKANSEGGVREIAKLHLNSLFGKFGANPDVTSKIVTLHEGRVKLVTGENEMRPPVYTAMAAFITAYARALTIRAAQANYATFAYADTDSLHLLTDTVPSDIRVHKSDIGAWKLEYHFQSALYVRSKFYLEKKMDGTYQNAMAGIPQDVSELMTFEDVVNGRVIDRAWMTERTGDSRKSAKLKPKNVPGGVVLADDPWTIKM